MLAALDDFTAFDFGNLSTGRIATFPMIGIKR